MNVYDTANRLAQEIQQSEEYKGYKSLKNTLMGNPDTKSKIENFEKLRYEIQLMQYTGEEKDEAKNKKLEEMYTILVQDKQIKEYGIRNATTTCIAPTGTISMIASASGGIEPLFGLVFSRLILDGTEMLEVNEIFKNYMISHKLYSEDLMKQIAVDGSIAHIDGIPDDVKKIFVTAHDISPYWHVKMQAAFQLHTDNAVSKTVNFVESATRENIEETYVLAYKNHLKGITVYRNNSRIFQPMNLDKKVEKKEEEKIVEATVEETKEYNPTGEVKTITCPECGNKIEMAEGCFICLNCGYSGCS